MTGRQDSAGSAAPSNSGGERVTYPASPCISVCTLDDDSVCLGCGRTVQQISRWAMMSKDEQWSVVDALAAERAGK
tara:strand:- start:1495 stop:1722 length:228 start_codon:yes stop_codon:yes gene_type:complete